MATFNRDAAVLPRDLSVLYLSVILILLPIDFAVTSRLLQFGTHALNPAPLQRFVKLSVTPHEFDRLANRHLSLLLL